MATLLCTVQEVCAAGLVAVPNRRSPNGRLPKAFTGEGLGFWCRLGRSKKVNIKRFRLLPPGKGCTFVVDSAGSKGPQQAVAEGFRRGTAGFPKRGREVYIYLVYIESPVLRFFIYPSLRNRNRLLLQVGFRHDGGGIAEVLGAYWLLFGRVQHLFGQLI